MKKSLTGVVAALALIFGLPGCDVEQIQDGEMPTVDVDAEPGTMPEYDVEGPDVDVTAEEKQVTVPDVDVEMEEKTITTPDIDVDLPKDD